MNKKFYRMMTYRFMSKYERGIYNTVDRYCYVKRDGTENTFVGSVAELCLITGFNEREVKTAIKILKDKKLLIVEGAHKNPEKSYRTIHFWKNFPIEGKEETVNGEIDIATGERVYMTYEHQMFLYNQGVRSRPSFKEDDPRTLEIINSSLQFKTMEEIQGLKKRSQSFNAEHAKLDAEKETQRKK